MTLSAVLAPDPPDFALLHRPRSAHPDRVEVLLGTGGPVPTLADLALSPPRSGRDTVEKLVLLPYRQLSERGLACHDDGTPLLVLPIRQYAQVSVDTALDRLPRHVPVLRDGHFDPGDEEYAAIVRRVLADEIGRGEGSNFVVRRAFRARLAGHPVAAALAVFRRLLAGERGAYWTFVVYVGGRTLVGASPERHVSLADGVATMNPISGTYRYPPGGPSTDDLLRFLADRKEAEELYMVVDEELKMLGRVCERGARLSGPRLTEMAHLAHTEYTLSGSTSVDVRELLRETMFAPTVIGSPLANACRVVSRYEPRGRGYYGGVLALVGQRDRRRTLDSAIVIRTAELTPDGGLELGVGATLVRRSDPDTEVAETRAKAGALLAALAGTPPRNNGGDSDRDSGRAGGRASDGHSGRVKGGGPVSNGPSVGRALAARNERLNRFWLAPSVPSSELAHRRILVVDAGDGFTVMLGHVLRALGPDVTVADHTDVRDVADYDAVVVGPGPGNPCAVRDPKIAALRTLTRSLLAGPVPLLSVCLGHQVLAGLLGLPLRRRPVPAQGEQREIDFFGRTERVGFYNTFAAYADSDRWYSALVGIVEVCRDRATGEVYGLRAAGTRSVQFHPESLLTQHGEALVRDLMTSVLRTPAIR